MSQIEAVISACGEKFLTKVHVEKQHVGDVSIS